MFILFPFLIYAQNFEPIKTIYSNQFGQIKNISYTTSDLFGNTNTIYFNNIGNFIGSSKTYNFDLIQLNNSNLVGNNLPTNTFNYKINNQLSYPLNIIPQINSLK